MPSWTFKNTETEEEYEEFFSTFDKKEEFLAEHPEIVQLIGRAPAIVSGVGGVKLDSGYKDLMGAMKKFYGPSSTIQT